MSEKLTELAAQVQLLEVARAELATLRPERAVYQRRGQLLLRTEQALARQRVEVQLRNAVAAQKQAAAAQQQQLQQDTR